MSSPFALDTLKKILLIQLGDVGDIVWTTPTIQAVKEACPQAELSLLVREGNGLLLTADPAVHKIFSVKKYGGPLYDRLRRQYRFLRDFRREGFDLAIDLRADERGAVMARLSGAPVRVALRYEGLRFRNRCFNRLVTPAPREKTEPGAANQSLCIVRELGIEARMGIPKLWIEEEVAKNVERLLQVEKVTEVPHWASLNPFSRWPYKELPPHTWVEIIDWLWMTFQIATVIVGSEGERERAEELALACSGTVVNLAGRTNLAELAALIASSSLHLGVDSAAPHIAAALGRPSVTIYGPSDWRDWALIGERNRVVVAERECAPCHQKGCQNRGSSECLEALPVGKIKETLQDVIADSFMRDPVSSS